MARISGLVTDYNSVAKSLISSHTSIEVARWISSMINTFGLNGEARPDSTSIGWSGVEIPEFARSYVTTISATRDELRQRARSSKGIDVQDIEELERGIPDAQSDGDTASRPYRQILQKFRTDITDLKESNNLAKEVLSLCDRIRDVDLWSTGIYLEDRDGESALIRPVTRELRAARAEKEDRDRQKQMAKEERERQAAAKADKGRLSHLDMFRSSEYSAWNDEGLPTKDRQGAEITKSREKKLRKEWTAQKKLHETWLKSNEASNGST